MMQSIVEQLQEEMKALKEKLRQADIQLQLNQSPTCTTTNTSQQLLQSTEKDAGIHKTTSIDVANVSCSTCDSYESKIQDLLKKSTQDHEQIEGLQKSLEDAKTNIMRKDEELEKEAALRKDLENQWQEKREAHKTEVKLLRDQVKSNEEKLLELQQKFLETKEDITRKMQKLSDERERINKHLETLQADNDFLSGKFLATSEEIENQYINLPNTVEELQVCFLT